MDCVIEIRQFDFLEQFHEYTVIEKIQFDFLEHFHKYTVIICEIIVNCYSSLQKYFKKQLSQKRRQFKFYIAFHFYL